MLLLYSCMNILSIQTIGQLVRVRERDAIVLVAMAARRRPRASCHFPTIASFPKCTADRSTCTFPCRYQHTLPHHTDERALNLIFHAHIVRQPGRSERHCSAAWTSRTTRSKRKPSPPKSPTSNARPPRQAASTPSFKKPLKPSQPRRGAPSSEASSDRSRSRYTRPQPHN